MSKPILIYEELLKFAEDQEKLQQIQREKEEKEKKKIAEFINKSFVEKENKNELD